MMTFWTVLLAIWIVCIPLAYVMIRLCHWLTCEKWTRMDRIETIVYAITLAPVACIAIGITAFAYWVRTSDWSKREVKW